MNKLLKSFLLGIVATFLVAGSVMALPLNTRTTPVVPVNGNLQATLNSIMTNPWDVINDQENNAVFTHTGSSGSVASFVFTDWGVADTVGHSFGIYEYGNSSNSLEIFGGGYNPSDQVTVTFRDNIVYSSTTTLDSITGIPIASVVDYTKDAFSNFGFYYTTTLGTFYTEDDLNGGNAMALIYQANSGQAIDIDGDLQGGTLGSEHWLIAFDGTDFLDFNDAVVLVESITPVPEPTTMLLFGMGLLGLAGITRKKIQA